MTNDLTEMIAVMTAAKEGKPIQFTRRNIEGDHWMCASSPTWDWDSKEYRVKPPEPTPEQLRLENTNRLKAEYELKPFEWQYKKYDEAETEWRSRSDGGAPYWYSDTDYRRKPAPTFEPWSFSDCPMERIRVRSKLNHQEAALVCYPDGAWICFSIYGNNSQVTYADLLRDFEQLNGQPCGTERSEK